jgi:TRAP-type C4-dicarboxylate transport system permease small subunit
MPRQRIRERKSPLMIVGRLLTFLFALALIWYGLMIVLLALKVSPSRVNSLSGYRTAFDWLAGLQPHNVDGGVTRAIVAGAGVLAFLLFAYLAYKEIPRPHLTRHDLQLSSDARGEVIIEPRAVERLAETAAQQHPAVSAASGRYGEHDLTVNITVRRAHELAETIRDTQRRVIQALEDHALPALPVNVTLTGYDRRHRRELN